MNGPRAFVEHLRKYHYHPRSDAHSNAICMGILHDLINHCEPLATKARFGQIVAKLNHTITVNYQRWNIDLALGPPAGTPVPPPSGQNISFNTPSLVEIAIEAKGVMTEHGKARHNRLRDLQAFHHHAHIYNDDVVAVGVIVVNLSPVFWSPTRSNSDITFHNHIDQLGAETVALFRNLPLRNTSGEGPGLEAASVLVVKHDNILKNETPPPGAPKPEPSELITNAPAPEVGDPLHYATMIRRICRAYSQRWP